MSALFRTAMNPVGTPNGARILQNPIFGLLNRKPTHTLMKNLYTALLAGTAMMIAGSAVAQKAGTQTKRFTTLHPVHASNELRGGGGPANDECTGATIQTVTIGTDLTINGDNTGGTDTEAIGFSTTWEAIELADCANLVLSYCGTNPVFGNFALGIGDCPITSVITPSGSDDCGDGNIAITYNEVPAGTWYIPVLVDTSATGPYTITVSSTACLPPPPPPANDDCAGVVALPVGTWCNFQNFTGAGATQTMDNDSCAGFLGSPEDDVWFSFVATASDLTIAIQGTDDGDGSSNTGYDAIIELYTTCGSGTPLSCADATLGSELEQIDASALTVGSTYFIRAFDFYDGLWPDHSFGICVTSGTLNIGMEESEEASFSIFPNPGAGVFNVNYTGHSGLANVEVMDITGRIVSNVQSRVANGTVLNLDLTGVSTGNYNVRLTVNGVRTEQRLMVK